MQSSKKKRQNLRAAQHHFWQSETPARWEYIAAACVLVLCFALFAHDDIIETANHTWLFLEDLFSGQFFNFYERTLAHTTNTLYYVNGAHYNVLLYTVFGIFMLPLYLVCKLLGVVPPQALLMYWAKLLACAFTVGCAVLTARIGRRTGLSAGTARYAGLFCALSPLMLFGAFTMGQYDSVCLFFLLLALVFYFDKRLTAFSLIMGVAAVCKFFAFLPLVLLLLLAEKRILPLLKYLALSLWLYVPTALLFYHRDGDMSVFSKLMIERLFGTALPMGFANVPLFFTAFALLAAVCYFYHPKNEAALQQTALYVCMAAFALLFLCMLWHPQWLVLLVPFMVLTTLHARNKFPWWCMDALLALGFFCLCYINFPGQLEVNLLDTGLVGLCSGVAAGRLPHRLLSFYFGLLPYVNALAPVLFAAPLLAALGLKLPLSRGIPSDILAGQTTASPSLRAGLWGICTVGFFGFFILPVVFQWLKCVL